MRPSLVLALSAVLVGAVVVPALPSAASERESGAAAPAFFSPPRQLVQYGHVRSLTRTGSRFTLRFDPAFWLGGVTANRAAVEDGAIAPGDSVPNDYYIRDERRRALTYLVPAGARVTVLTNEQGQGIRSTRVSVAELAQIVRGRNPQGRALYDRSNSLGYWARVATDTVRSLDQQYQP